MQNIRQVVLLAVIWSMAVWPSCKYVPHPFASSASASDTAALRIVLDTMYTRALAPPDSAWCDSVLHFFNRPELFKQHPDYVYEAFKWTFIAFGYSNPRHIDSFQQLMNKYPVEKYKPWITYWRARTEVEKNYDVNEKATLTLLDAYSQFKKNNDSFGEAMCCKWLGFLYMQAGEYQKSITYSKMALGRLTNPEEVNILYDNLYQCYDRLEQYDSALYYSDNYLSPYKPYYGTDTCKYNYYLKHAVKQTDEFFKVNIPLFLQQPSKTQGLYATNIYCTLLMRQKRFGEAKAYIEKGLSYTDSSDNEGLYKIAYKIYDSLHDYRQAYKYFMLDYNLDKQNFTSSKQTNVQAWLKKSDYKLKEQQLNFEKQIAAQQLQVQQKQAYFLITGCVLLLAIAVLIFFNYKNQKQARQKTDSLLFNILPEEVAEELKLKGNAEAKLFENVTVFFSDFKNFTIASEKLTPQDLVNELHQCFTAFDNIMQKYNIEKIKTVGDAYLAVSGLPTPNPNHAADVVNAALEIKEFMKTRSANELSAVRIGVHSGHVVAGIVGVKKFAYDIWGDTVNTAARMEQNGEAGKVNISESTYALVKDKFNCTYRGEIEAKNKGKLKMYFVESL